MKTITKCGIQRTGINRGEELGGVTKASRRCWPGVEKIEEDL